MFKNIHVKVVPYSKNFHGPKNSQTHPKIHFMALIFMLFYFSAMLNCIVIDCHGCYFMNFEKKHEIHKKFLLICNTVYDKLSEYIHTCILQVFIVATAYFKIKACM